MTGAENYPLIFHKSEMSVRMDEVFETSIMSNFRETKVNFVDRCYRELPPPFLSLRSSLTITRELIAIQKEMFGMMENSGSI